MGAEFTPYGEKHAPPFTEGAEAVKAWCATRALLLDALRESTAWARLYEQHLQVAEQSLEGARSAFLAAIDQAYSAATKEPRQMLSLLSDYETDRKEQFKTKLARIRADWQDVIEKAMAEAAG